MHLRPSAAVLACALVAAAALGCGKSKQEQIFEEQRNLCLSLPAQGLTIRAATEAFGDFPWGPTRCLPGPESGAPTHFERLPQDVCEPAAPSLCELGWCYYPNDPGLCGPNGCWFGCQVRVVAPGGATGVTEDSVICASRWVAEQPLPPFCGTIR